MKKESLHLLIHSLTRSEKRYFKLFCTRETSGKNYQKLFVAIERQKVYDEKAIKAQFQGEKFVRQLHVTKNYLHKLILKSLRNFHANISKDAELKECLHNVELLFMKELFAHCKVELKRAENIARKYELLTGLIEVENWKRKLEQTIHPQNYDAFQEAVSAQKSAIDALADTNTYWQLAIDLSRRMFSGERTPLPNLSWLSDAGHAKTLEAKVLHFNGNYLLALQRQESNLAGKALFELLEVLEAFPERIKENPGQYVASINNLVSYLVFTKKHAQALELVQKAKSIYESWNITSENRTLLKQMLRTYNIELEIYRDTRTYEQHLAFIRRTETFLEAMVNKVPKDYLVLFWFQFASIHFMRKDFDRSLQWINLLLNNRYRDVRTDLQVQARMLNLMVHLEQQNLMVLRYYVDSTRRFMKKMRQAKPYEKILLKFFVKIGRLPFADYKQAFSDLLEQLFPKDSEPLISKDILGYVDYQTWINGKIGGN